MKAIDRFYEYLAEKSLKPTAIEKEIGLSNGYLSAQKKRNADMGEGMLLKIIDYFRDINPLWLLTGEGSMLRDNKNNDESKRSSTAITTPILPTEESIIYKMYKEKDEENKILIEKIGGLKERIRQLESQNKESEHPSIVGNITEAFTKESSGDYGEDSRSAKLLSGSKRSSVGKV